MVCVKAGSGASQVIVFISYFTTRCLNLLKCRSGKRAVLQLLENRPFHPPAVGLNSLWNSQPLAAPPMWFRLFISGCLWRPCKSLCLLWSCPALLPCPGWWGQHIFFRQFLHLYCSFSPASQEEWQGFPEHPLTPHGPLLSEHKPHWTLITHCCTLGPPASPHLGRGMEPATSGWSFLEACGAIPGPLSQLPSTCAAMAAHHTHPHQVPPTWLHRILNKYLILDNWWIYDIHKPWRQFYS